MTLGLKSLIEDIRKDGHIKEMTTHDLHDELEHSGNSFVFIDVREAAEWKLGHIPGAIHLSKGVIEVKIEQVIPNKEQKIVLYCGGGTRSLIAAESLSKMGYTNCISMLGGIREWGQQYPISNE